MTTAELRKKWRGQKRKYRATRAGREAMRKDNCSQSHRDREQRYRLKGREAFAIRKYLTKPGIAESKKLRDQEYKKQKTAAEHHEKAGNNWSITLKSERINTLDKLIRHCEIDKRIWKIDRHVINKWEVGAKGPDGHILVEPLFQVKAWLSKNAASETAIHLADELLEKLKKYSPKLVKTPRLKRTDGTMLEMNLTDHHFGKLAWGEETGHENYDAKIAAQAWHEGVEAILARSSGYKHDCITFVLGNDLLHTDNMAGTTTRGTQQDTDTRFKKTFKLAQECVITALERVRRVAPVRVMVIPGNHDELAAWHLGSVIEAYFNNTPDVQVDNKPSPRRYARWGKVMIMWTHGSGRKLASYPQIMAVERPDLWYKCPIREVHTGDKHQRRLEEFHGVAVRILPTLCAPDDWHSREGYVGNMRMSEAFIWHKEDGLLGTANYTWPEQLHKRYNAA